MPGPVPIGDTSHRLPQAGRIRIGAKDDKARGGRKAISTFRFTSGDAELLAPVAERYGGTVKPWNEPKSGDRFEVTTQASKIDVILPPNALTEYYELWDGKVGLARRCDGVTMATTVQGPDGPEIQERPCVCFAKGVLECDYKLRLSVMLPDVASIGTWRLDTSSEHARKEIPGVVQVIEMIDQGRGLFRAKLRLEQRTAPGKRFNVPVLDTGVGVEALLAGETRLDALPSQAGPPLPALGTGSAPEEEGAPHRPTSGALPSTDDEVIEGEIVEVDDWVEDLDARGRSRALVVARRIAEAEGSPLPTSLDDCTPALLGFVYQELTQ
jgi:hypothetical protein